MFRLICIVTIFTAVLFAKDKVEIYASSMETADNIVKAHGEVTVVYKDYFLTSKEASYDRNSGELELFGNVRANYNNEYKILGKYAKLNIINKDKAFKPFYLLEKKSQVWISANNGTAQDKEMSIDFGTLSGCNPNNPLWTMDFSSSTYNTHTQWLDIYNARLYIYDIPVFYTPYFGYSLNKTRRTGLLLPEIGFSDEEGFYYEQPIYIAKQNWWDLELSPQIRTDRGLGLYSKFRFVDSDVSSGEFTTGYFQEKTKYYEKNELANKSHYGFNFKYNNSDFTNQWFDLDLDAQSGLFIDITNMNDVDYINLSTNDSLESVTSSQILSRINMFYNENNNYYGAYFKHYKDLELNNNDNTLQKLPTIHYHSYLDTFFDEHLLYNIDIKSNSIYRKINKRVIQTDINIPVTIQTSLFDEFLNLSYTSYFNAQHSSFSGKEETPTVDEYKSGIFTQQYNILSASTKLTRGYEEITHVVDFGIEYIFDDIDSKSGFYEYNKDYCSVIGNENDSRCEFCNVTDIEETLKLSFSQYFFDSYNNQKLYHRVSQIFSFENDRDKKYEDLENELEFQITDNFSFYNNILYNHDEERFVQIYNKLFLNSQSIDLSFSYLYKDEPKSDNANYITMDTTYIYDSHYSYIAKYDYDLELNLRKNAELGFLYKKRCWEFGLKYVENNRPLLTNNTQLNSIKDRYIYLTIIFKPFIKSGSNPIFIHKLPQND